MKQTKGSIAPIAAVVIVLLLGVGLYMMGRSADLPAVDTNTAPVENEEMTQAEENALAAEERANWITYVNAENGYSISYPPEWARGGTADSVILTGATNLRIEIEATDLAEGTTLSAFADEASGNTFARTATTLNGYQALQAVEDLNTTHYIVDGTTGYRIIVKNPGAGVDNNARIQEVLRTFMITAE